MPILSPDEASVLALLAQHPNAPASKRRELVKLLGPEGKQVAEAMRATPAPTSERAAATAKGLIRWAGGNAKLRSNSGETLARASGIKYKVVVGDKRDSNIVLGHGVTTTKRKSRKSAKKST